MSESRGMRLPAVVGVLVIAAAAVGMSGCAGSTGGGHDVRIPDAPSRILPWEWWRDLASIASVPDGDRVLMNSSFCRTGCAHDRHSAGDSRFLRMTKNGEGVIFSADGVGAVTRIWMVMGDGISESLDPGIRLRVRIDGRRRPVVDLPLPAVFDGSTPPFLAPLVADPRSSGGGNVSYVPIPFREGCEISLVGAENAKIWFQVAAHMVDDATGVRPFTGDENLDDLRSMLERAGGDPWQAALPPAVNGAVTFAPGESQLIATLQGPDIVNGVLIRTSRKHWGRLGLRLSFDDRPPQLIPLLDLMGVMTSESGASGSLMMGSDDDGDLYCYFPMPFFERATVELLRRPVEGPAKVRVEYALRVAGSPPPDDAGYFSVQARRHRPAESAGEIDLVDGDGTGKLVGVVADLSPVTGRGWSFLELDERIRVDGEEKPSWHGTGVEDFFNGGFYFREEDGEPTPFTTALAGAPLLRGSPPKAVMYRLLLGDAVAFRDGIHATLEANTKGGASVRGRTTAFLYTSARDSKSAESEPIKFGFRGGSG